MKIVVVYDDTGRKSEVITDIIGENGFADVVVKKKRLEEYYREEITKIYPDIIWKKVHYLFEYPDLIKEMELYTGSDTRVLHCFSNYFISDGKTAALSLKKLAFIDESFGMLDGKYSVGAMFPNTETYAAFCKNIMAGQKAWDIAKNMQPSFQMKGIINIGETGNFIQCITGNFDSRYFNSLQGDEYTIEKSSTNKKKIKAEYSFYHLLPEDMKFWFVMPFHYKETDKSASYTMERLHMTDLSIKWVHGSMGETEFEDLLDKYFFFFKSRHRKDCTEQEYQKNADSLYVQKVNDRIAELKQLPQYEKIKLLSEVSPDLDIDFLKNKYLALKEKIENKVNYPFQFVIGHGDPCFANTMYNKSTKTLKFIDPKGALTEEELWTNPYYDVAKLSHSICGRYDFFNHALFEIKVGSTFSYELEIPFDHTKYIEIFRRKTEENGFDYWSVRIYEASLFLSMLPLHMDNPHKVFGFILNVKNILEEIERNV